MTWRDWARKHAVAFGMANERDGATLCEWSRQFAAAGYDPGELASATEWLILHPPKFPNRHLDSLLGFVRDRRARDRNAAEAQARREAEPELIAGDCPLCAGTGLVQGLTWTKRTRSGRPVLACVSCRCETGVSLHRRRLEAGYPLRSLDEHERAVPDWRTRKPETKPEMPDTGLGAAIEKIIQRARAMRK